MVPRKPVKRRKKQDWMHQADRLFSKLVRARDGSCLAVGAVGVSCSGYLQCCHIIGRGELSIRLDFDNAIAMCAGHHRYFTSRPAQWQDWIDIRFPGRWDVLRGRVREHRAGNGRVDWKHELELLKKDLSLLAEGVDE